MTKTREELMQLRRVAEAYEARGYQVLQEPDDTQLPAQLSSLRADLVALSDDDCVVIEVRSSGSMGDDPIRRTAAKVEGLEGWRFELHTTARPNHLATDGINSRLQEAKEVLAIDVYPGAALIAWTAAEAALRALADEGGIGAARGPSQLIRELFTEGQLRRSLYERLQLALRTRNAVAHGLESGAQVTRARAEELIELAEDLLTELEGGAQASRRLDLSTIADWFGSNYVPAPPETPLTTRSGYLHVRGGPYAAATEIAAEFPDADADTIADVVNKVAPNPEAGFFKRDRTLGELLAELKVEDAGEVDITRHHGFSSSSLQVAQESGRRALAANKRGDRIASSQAVSLGITAKEVETLTSASAHLGRRPERDT